MECRECGSRLISEPGGYVSCEGCDYHGRLWEDYETFPEWNAPTRGHPELCELTREILKEEGPLSHEDLTERLGIDSEDTTQKVVRELRNKGHVAINLDKEYEFTER